jgi:hypothetical protein
MLKAESTNAQKRVARQDDLREHLLELADEANELDLHVVAAMIKSAASVIPVGSTH